MHSKKNPNKIKVLTDKEIEIIRKKTANEKITQYESNRLSKSIRPKLRQMVEIDAKNILEFISYKPKVKAIENNIKNCILNNINSIDSITLFGSAIITNYLSYNDIDLLIIVKNKFWKNLGGKYDEIIKLKEILKAKRIKADIEIYEKEDFIQSYPSNPSLIYQLKDKKTIYGRLNLPSEIYLSPLELRMKLDYSIIEKNARGNEIYKAIRNLALINLILKKIIDNKRLNEDMSNELGINLINSLKLNRESKMQREMARIYLTEMVRRTIGKLKEAKWEKIAQ